MNTTAKASRRGTVIEARSIGKEFHGGVCALTDVSFALEPNRIHGLLGRNGAGKTTLMRDRTGQESPTSGAENDSGEPPIENTAVHNGRGRTKETQASTPRKQSRQGTTAEDKETRRGSGGRGAGRGAG